MQEEKYIKTLQICTQLQLLCLKPSSKCFICYMYTLQRELTYSYTCKVSCLTTFQKPACAPKKIGKVSNCLCWYSNVTKVQKSPALHFSSFSKLLPRDWGGRRSRTCSCFMLIPPKCSSLHTVGPITLLWQGARRDQSVYTCWVSDPQRSRRSVWSWILSLTQTSCPLTVICSSFCCRPLKVFSVNCCAAHSIFCLSPKEIGLSLFSLFGWRPITGLSRFTPPDAERAKEHPRGAGIFY